MSNSSLIDAIVAGVLKQLGQGDDARSGGKVSQPVKAPDSLQRVCLTNQNVITAEVLEEFAADAKLVAASKRAIITPAAWDWLKEHKVELERGEPSKGTQGESKPTQANSPPVGQPLLIVVHSTPAVDQIWEQLKSKWRREFLGCPDDAAKLAIGEICRGATSQVVILAEQTFRAACLANRHEKVKAVSVESALDIKLARLQLRVNTWCVNPKEKSWFELKTILSAINTPGH